MTYIGGFLTAKGIKPIVKYQHAFKNTYLQLVNNIIAGLPRAEERCVLEQFRAVLDTYADVDEQT